MRLIGEPSVHIWKDGCTAKVGTARNFPWWERMCLFVLCIRNYAGEEESLVDLLIEFFVEFSVCCHEDDDEGRYCCCCIGNDVVVATACCSLVEER